METEACPYCGEFISEDEQADHDKGRDAKRLACSHQDLDKIAEDREPQRWKHGVALPGAW